MSFVQVQIDRESLSGTLRRAPALRRVLAACAVLLCCAACDRDASAPDRHSVAPVAERPNIVLIITDDQRADLLGCAGSAIVKTPAIDRLAREGVFFDHAFVVTPVCAPSRATMLTGRPTYAHGVTRNGLVLDESAPTVATYLQAAGYATAFFGKYHVTKTSSNKPGFDHAVHFRSIREGGAGPVYFDAEFTIDGQPVRSKGFSTDRLTEYAAGWIGRKRTRPFFMILSPKNAHTSHFPPKRHARLYAEVEFPLPVSYFDPLDRLPDIVREDRTSRPVIRAPLLRNYYDGLSIERDGDPVQHLLRGYARMIPSIDDMVGGVYAALEQHDLLDNTVIVFTSDNGMLAGEHGIIGKGLAYEAALRVPLIIRDPRQTTAGTHCDKQILNLDLLPTILELAGVAIPESLSGRSIVPLLAGLETDWRSDWLMVSHSSDRRRDEPRPEFMAVRNASRKYIRYLRGGLQQELFDLANDPDERVNLAADPAHVDELLTLRRRMRELMKADGLPRGWWKPFSE